MRLSTGRVAIVVLFLGGAPLAAQEHGPTVAAARVAVVAPSLVRPPAAVAFAPAASCGSAWKNAVLLGLGLSLATAAIELTYTLVREPFVRNGQDWPAADPALIAWAGGAGFVVGLVGTGPCQRRTR